GPEIQDSLRRALGSSLRLESELEAIRALGQLKGAGSLPILGNLIVAEPVSRRVAAQRAIAAIGGSQARDLLRTLSINTNPAVRKEGVVALGLLRDSAVVPDLM